MRRIGTVVALVLWLLLLTAAPASAHQRYCGHGYHWHWDGVSVQFVSHKTVAGVHLHTSLLVPGYFRSHRLVTYICGS